MTAQPAETTVGDACLIIYLFADYWIPQKTPLDIDYTNRFEKVCAVVLQLLSHSNSLTGWAETLTAGVLRRATLPNETVNWLTPRHKFVASREMSRQAVKKDRQNLNPKNNACSNIQVSIRTTSKGFGKNLPLCFVLSSLFTMQLIKILGKRNTVAHISKYVQLCCSAFVLKVPPEVSFNAFTTVLPFFPASFLLTLLGFIAILNIKKVI